MKIEQVLLDAYQVRKTKAQKTVFIEYVKGLCAEHNLPMTVEQKGSTRNIVIGDTDNASVIFGAHYDTCANMVVPNFITPKNVLVYILYSLLLAGVIFAVAVAAGLAADMLLWEGLYSPVFLIVLWSLLILMMAGPANPHTANDNTSGTATVLCLALELPEELREDVCFVLFDKEELGLIGSSFFASKHKQAAKNAFMINFDCVGDGDALLFVPKKKAYKAAEYELLCGIAREVCDCTGKELLPCKNGQAMYPSDQANFQKGVGVAFLRKKRFIGYYMNRIHTKRDTILQTENLDALVAICRKFLENKPHQAVR